MADVTGPSLATVKRLFAVSGNRCAFPRCEQALVHAEGKVTGRICHIRASNSGGPRFDAGQTVVERHAFDNLILLCPTHHDVIDADEVAYTIDRLRSMKVAHEAKHAEGDEASDEIATQMIVDLSGVQVTGGSIIVSNNQVGGQVAHVINNYGPPKRIITEAIRTRMMDVLRQAKPARIGFASTQGDLEAHEFKGQMMAVFHAAGWEVEDMQTFMFFGERKGIVLTIPFGASEQGLPQIVAHALAQTGNEFSGNHGDMAKDCGFYVQVWHAQ